MHVLRKVGSTCVTHLYYVIKLCHESCPHVTYGSIMESYFKRELHYGDI